jgi:Chaperone of endosialidase
MSKSDPPTPPDPRQTAAAATSTNIGTGVANAFLNNTNQITPQGELRYDQTGTYTWNDPETGRSYNIPRFTATQILSDQQQSIADQTNEAKYNLAGMANTQSKRVSDLLGTPFNPSQGSPGSAGSWDANAYLAANPDVAAWAASSGMSPSEAAAQHYRDFGQREGRSGLFNATGPTGPAPAAGDPTFGGIGDPRSAMGGDVGQQTGTLRDTGLQQREFGDAGDITRSYAPDDNWSADRSRVEDSLFQRLNPQLDRERANLEQRLNDQGIRYGSTAYTQAMDDYNRQSNDMRLAVTAAGGQEQTRMADMAAKAAGFENAAQQQAYTQAQGRGQFYNTAQQADYAQALSSGQFGNAAQKDQFAQEMAKTNLYNTSLAQQLNQRQSQFNAQNATRQQYMQEQYAQRNQPLNEIGALLSGSQVQGPNFVNTPNSQIATTDIAGLINNRFSQDMDIYKTESANSNALLGGIFGMLGGLGRGMLSDVREKENIRPMGTVFAANEDGGKEALPVYEYSYKKDPASTRHVGPMAQDVEKIDRRAVQTRGGRKYIDTTRLGSILKVA